MTKLTKNKVKQAINKSYGIILEVANRCKVSREHMHRYIQKNEDIKKLLLQEREKMLDITEGKLYSQVNKEESWAIKFYLTTQGKARGYGEQTTIKHEGKLTHELFQQAYQEYHDKEKSDEEEDAV